MRRTLRVCWLAVGRYLVILLGFALFVPWYGATLSHAEQDPPDDTSVPIVVKPASKLSTRLVRLAEPVLRTADAATRANALGLPPNGAGSLVTTTQGEVLTYIRVAETSAATLAALTQRGARIVHVASAYLTVTAYVRPDQLNALSMIAAVNNVREVLAPKITDAPNARQPRAQRAQAAPRTASCPSGLVSEGDPQLKAAQARSQFGVDGAGVSIGVLSDSYNTSTYITTADDDIATGDLPGTANPCGFTTPVNVLDEYPTYYGAGSDEGRGMLQIVHDLAPASTLSFATADNGLFSFADNIRALQRAGANVIVDDVGYYVEPFYQDGPVSVAIKDVTQAGALYFTAAGNDDLTDAAGNLIGSYESIYRPKGCVRLTSGGQVYRPGQDCQNFDPKGLDSLQRITVQPGGSFIMILQWSEPWYGVTSDFDLYVVDQDGRLLAEPGIDMNNGSQGTQLPVEGLFYENYTAVPQNVNIVIARYKGTGIPRIRYNLYLNSGHITATEFNATNSTDTFGPTIFGHSAEASALSVAAVPFNDATTPEHYTSRGPATMYFGPVRDTTPAPRLATPEVRNKPDITATDGVRTTFFYQHYNDEFYRFYGTSAAAPHAAAVGALMIQQGVKLNRTITQSRASELMMANAALIPNGVRANVGAGLLDAQRAVGAVATLPQLEPVLLLPLVQR